MSTLSVANISDGTDTVETGYVVNGSAKVWVNFNGTGTVAVRDSFNVSGLTDDGTGVFTVSFTNAMSSADFATTTSCGPAVYGADTLGVFDPLAGSVSLVCTDKTGVTRDLTFNNASTNGDLA